MTPHFVLIEVYFAAWCIPTCRNTERCDQRWDVAQFTCFYRHDRTSNIWTIKCCNLDVVTFCSLPRARSAVTDVWTLVTKPQTHLYNILYDFFNISSDINWFQPFNVNPESSSLIGIIRVFPQCKIFRCRFSNDILMSKYVQYSGDSLKLCGAIIHYTLIKLASPFVI